MRAHRAHPRPRRIRADTDLSRLWDSQPPGHALLEELVARREPAGESIDVVVCVTNEVPSYFPDEVYTTCADCGIGIHHRPYVGTQAKTVCLTCLDRVTEEVAAR